MDGLDWLPGLAERLVGIDGIAGVVLGGSRARREAHPDSDADLGLYYRAPLDTDGLRRLAAELTDARAAGERPEVTEPGGWGRWVDGGGWLRVAGTDVDWLYRDIDRVITSIQDSLAGRITTGFQVGHPFGVPSYAYAGELALGVLLADPTEELAALQARLQPYPDALRQAVVDGLWEADFLLGGGSKPAKRGDATMVAGLLFRVMILAAHAVAARSGRWVITEKGLIDSAGRMASAPPDFAVRAHALLGAAGRTPAQLTASLAAAAELVRECRG